jgi:uncharacterized protein (TIGR02246 family)
MLKSILRSLLILLMGALVSLRGAEVRPALSAAEKERVAASVCEQMNTLMRTAETFDAAKALAVLTDDADAIFFFNSKPYGKQKLIETLTTIYGTLSSMKTSMDKPRVTVLGPDAAVWTATGTARSVGKTGAIYVEALTETWVWQRQNGAWRVVHSNESAAVPDTTPATPGK